jgi:hypothetical protein
MDWLPELICIKLFQFLLKSIQNWRQIDAVGDAEHSVSDAMPIESLILRDFSCKIHMFRPFKGIANELINERNEMQRIGRLLRLSVPFKRF